jgi:acyl-CoA synthetase (NDP forming)
MTTNGMIESIQPDGRTVLNEIESKQRLLEAGLPVVVAKLAADADAAVAIADEIGYPVAIKIVSPQITHKSDTGGVRLGLQDAESVREAYRSILADTQRARPDASIDGVSVQRMADPGVEVIAGMTTDPQFGPVLMFGLGGVFVEVLKDVSFRIVPMEAKDASEMIREVQGFAILEGHRGQPAVDLAALEQLLLQLSSFIEANPDISELDMNPVFAYPSGVIAVDARIVLSEPQ